MKKSLRLGIIGCKEHSHGRIWAELLTGPEGKKYGMHPAKIWDPDPDTAKELAGNAGAEYANDLPDAGKDVDGILITDLYADNYLELSRPFLETGRRVFFNRPFAGSVEDAQKITVLAEKHGSKIYSASALFHTEAAVKARKELSAISPLLLFNVTGPTDNVYFYLPHVIACFISVLGPGVLQVRASGIKWDPDDPHRVKAPLTVFVEYDKDSRIGKARGTIQLVGPGSDWYGFRMKLFGAKGESKEITFDVTYDILLKKMADFFRTGVEPVSHDILMEKTAIFYAILRSSRETGSVVRI